jgi:hypothetical protein
MRGFRRIGLALGVLDDARGHYLSANYRTRCGSRVGPVFPVAFGGIQPAFLHPFVHDEDDDHENREHSNSDDRHSDDGFPMPVIVLIEATRFNDPNVVAT